MGAVAEAAGVSLYDVARRVTDEVLGEGAYAEANRGNPDPGVQAAIRRAERRCPEHGQADCSPLLNGCARLTSEQP